MADDCRLCKRPLRRLSAAPVCADCLTDLTPLGDVARCTRCGVPFAVTYAGPVCGDCRLHEPAYSRAAAFGAYEGALRKLVHLLKYAQMRPLARPLAGHLAATVESSALGGTEVLVPVPLHCGRRRQRGFNQAELLARELGRILGIPVAPRALLRVRSTAAQAGLSASERKKNLASAFMAGRSEAFAGKKVLLIDDVLTTGATAHACARTLRRAGADEVAVLTLARAIPMEVQS